MKKLFILMLVVFSTATQAQEITELKEAIIIAPNARQVLNGNSDLTFIVREDSYAEFSKDPIAFMKSNFDIFEFIKFTSDEKYDSYLVTFQSSKGRLEADFDKDGSLKKNTQWFYDVELPTEIKNILASDHSGYTVEKNKYFSKGKGESSEKAYYKIKLVNGNDFRRIKLDPAVINRGELAAN